MTRLLPVSYNSAKKEEFRHMLHLNDTIVAIATPQGEGGIGVIRISGAKAFDIADRLFISKGKPLRERASHTLHYGRIISPRSKEVLDDAVVSLFRSPHSYTKEDVVEFSCHGGPVTLSLVLNLCIEEGARMAEPGEFTMRAFLNGGMDLAQAEAVCDQIRARTVASQRAAIRQRQGELSKRMEELRSELVGVLAAIEVTLDFSEDVGDLDYPETERRIKGLIRETEQLINMGRSGRLLREGVRIAIAGRPNVGKSSLMNALLRQNRSIVTPLPGTTRDVIEETINLKGVPALIMDTAGLRETQDIVESIGVDRARDTIKNAELVILLADAVTGWSEEEDRILSSLSGVRVLPVLNKTDMVSKEERERGLKRLREATSQSLSLAISALNGDGVEELEDTIYRMITGGDIALSESAFITNSRHIQALKFATDALRRGLETTRRRLPPDFISIDLRAALDEVGKITGETVTEDIIHRIFQDFCVGK